MMRPLRFIFLCLAASPLLAGCLANGGHGATIDVFGSYFPAWMACIAAGLVITIIVRLLLIGFGIHPHLRPKGLVYPCIAIFSTLLVWLIFFKN